MALARNRKRIYVKGIGTLEVSQREPSVATSFSDVGYLHDSQLTDVPQMEPIIPETGEMVNILVKQREITLLTKLMQVTIDEFNLIKNASTQLHAVRYSGLTAGDAFIYFSIDACRLIPEVNVTFNTGLRLLPVSIKVLTQDNLGYSVPVYYLFQGDAKIETANLQFWANARLGLNTATTKFLDSSGWARHGTLVSISSWQAGTPPLEYFTRYDGATYACDFGDVCDLGATDNFVFEGWFRVQAANGTLVRFVSKKQDQTAGAAGYQLYRTAGNLFTFLLSNGSSQYTPATTSTILQNVWKHFAVVVPKGGNAQCYLNGAADGGTVAIAASHDATNALSIQFARDNAGNFAQVDIGGVRIYNYATAAVPTNIATIISNHFTAERTAYGV